MLEDVINTDEEKVVETKITVTKEKDIITLKEDVYEHSIYEHPRS